MTCKAVIRSCHRTTSSAGSNRAIGDISLIHPSTSRSLAFKRDSLLRTSIRRSVAAPSFVRTITRRTYATRRTLLCSDTFCQPQTPGEPFRLLRSDAIKLPLVTLYPNIFSRTLHSSTHTMPFNVQPRPEEIPLGIVDQAKQKAAYQAVNENLDVSHTLVGIGSGSTVVYVIKAIAALGSKYDEAGRGPEDPAYKADTKVTDKMTFIPTGDQSKRLIIDHDLNLGSIDTRRLLEGKIQALDVAFDGADEVDPELNLIKGGGACLWQEKLVAAATKKWICVADQRKQKPYLCSRWPTVPVEVHPLAANDVLKELETMGSWRWKIDDKGERLRDKHQKDILMKPFIREGSGKAGPVVTDNGMWLIDAPFEKLVTDKKDEDRAKAIWEVTELAQKLKSILGVVEIGLFYGMNGPQASDARVDRGGQKPVKAYFGMDDGTAQCWKWDEQQRKVRFLKLTEEGEVEYEQLAEA